MTSNQAIFYRLPTELLYLTMNLAPTTTGKWCNHHLDEQSSPWLVHQISIHCRGFEIGNHFCEWMYYNDHKEFPFFYHDFSRYPTRDEQLNFIRAYIDEAKKIRGDQEDLDEEKILKEANYYALSSHLVAAIFSPHLALSSKDQYSHLVSSLHLSNILIPSVTTLSWSCFLKGLRFVSMCFLFQAEESAVSRRLQDRQINLKTFLDFLLNLFNFLKGLSFSIFTKLMLISLKKSARSFWFETINFNQIPLAISLFWKISQ